MISKLGQLKLDDPSAPGMTVFGDSGSQIAILHGEISTQETTDQQQPAAKGKYFLVISPKGFFLAAGRSDVSTSEESLSLALKEVRKSGQESNVSIDDKERLAISVNNAYKAFEMKKISVSPERFKEMLTSAIESSRKIAQRPLLAQIINGKAGNELLDAMIQEKQQPTTASQLRPPQAGSGETTTPGPIAPPAPSI